MKFLIIAVLMAATPAFAYTDFKVTKTCKKQAAASVIKNYKLEIATLADEGTYYPPGADGSSSWPEEWVIYGTVKQGDAICKALVYVSDSNDCTVVSLSKDFSDPNSYKCNF